jgi:hypothetical protein
MGYEYEWSLQERKARAITEGRGVGQESGVSAAKSARMRLEAEYS